MNTPKYLKELQTYIDTLEDYATLKPEIKKVKGKVVEVKVETMETVRVISNQDALSDVGAMIERLQDLSTTGLLHVVFDFQNGTIKTIGYKNTNTTRY